MTRCFISIYGLVNIYAHIVNLGCRMGEAASNYAHPRNSIWVIFFRKWAELFELLLIRPISGKGPMRSVIMDWAT